MEFNWDLILKDTNTCVCCRKKEQATALLKEAEKKKIKWNNGKYFEEKDIVKFKQNTCYYFVTGHYGDLDFAIKEYHTVLLYEDVIVGNVKTEVTKIKIKFLGEI